jgi:nicotinate-nucleotide--dimethylbenzimidazole phosphoribosyltransferase
VDLTIPPLSDDAMDAAYGAMPHGRHGKLEGLALWLCGVQGVAPPRPLSRRRVVVAGESPVAADVRAEGSFEDGLALADAEIDGGADVFVAVAPASVAAAALVAALSGAEPVDVVAPGAAWARDVAEVRDLLRTHRGAGPADLVDALGSPALVGLLVGAARRRTPVVLDGLAPCAAALAAETLAPLAVTYFMAGHVTPHPAHRAALATLALEPLLDLGIRADGGALLALPLLDAAVALVRED